MEQATDSNQIAFAVENSDITSFEADILALKFAQAFFGADRAVAQALESQADIQKALPRLDNHVLLATQGKIKARQVLFVSVPALYRFRYPEIRKFAATVLEILATDAPSTRHLAMTIHGVGYGLDETEAMRSQLYGLLDALKTNRYPRNLERITFVELNRDRAQMLRAVLQNELPEGIVTSHVSPDTWRSPPAGAESREPAHKPLVLVVMPLSEETEDIFHLGIQEPAYEAGYLCETVNVSLTKTMNAETSATATIELEGGSAYITELRKLLVQYLNDEELRTLCFDLGMDYGNLPGEGKAGKTRELLSELVRRTRLLELVEKVKQEYPSVNWPDFTITSSEKLLLESVKPKLDAASLVIADITKPNPSTLLLIGYAWGKEKPTILLTQDPASSQIRLDSQRYVIYRRIHKLKEALAKEFSATKNALATNR